MKFAAEESWACYWQSELPSEAGVEMQASWSEERLASQASSEQIHVSGESLTSAELEVHELSAALEAPVPSRLARSATGFFQSLSWLALASSWLGWGAPARERPALNRASACYQTRHELAKLLLCDDQALANSQGQPMTLLGYYLAKPSLRGW